MLLLSLVGEQPIPNLLPLWQYPGKYSAIQFAVTDRTQKIAEQMREFIKNDPKLQSINIEESLRLSAYDLQHSRRQIASAIVQNESIGNPLTVNLTGGTKIMSLAAMLAAFGTDVPLLYVSTEEKKIIHYRSDGTEKKQDELQIHISVETYLKAHGLEVSNNNEFNPHLGQYNHPSQKGDYLELKVENLAHESGYFDDVRRGVYIRKQTKLGLVTNELDIVVTRNGRMAVCSCKSGKHIEKEIIYELAALSQREKAGIYCGKVLVIDQPEVSESIRSRTMRNNIRLVFGEKIDGVAETLLNAVKVNKEAIS